MRKYNISEYIMCNDARVGDGAIQIVCLQYVNRLWRGGQCTKGSKDQRGTHRLLALVFEGMAVVLALKPLAGAHNASNKVWFCIINSGDDDL